MSFTQRTDYHSPGHTNGTATNRNETNYIVIRHTDGRNEINYIVVLNLKKKQQKDKRNKKQKQKKTAIHC